MSTKTIGIIMNGVSGRMGYRQHLVRSILAIRDQGGVLLSDGTRVQVEPILVGRNEAKLAELAAKHGIEHYSTDLDSVLADPTWEIYADFLVTKARSTAIRKAIAAGKAIYTEKPTAETAADALELANLAEAAGIKNGVVHDKLYLPGMQKLKRLVDSGFFGRILSVRGEFGYWVFEGDWQDAQRPSWNYRAEDGGGIVVDMFPHWSYVLENLFGRVESVYARAVTHIDERVDEQGHPYRATADDAAYAVFDPVIPARALRRLPVALEDPVAELAAHAEDASEEAGVDQPLQLLQPGQVQLVVHDAGLHAGVLGEARQLEGLFQRLCGGLLGVDGLAGGDGLLEVRDPQVRHQRVEVDLVVGVRERLVDVGGPLRQPVLLGDAAQLLLVAAHQQQVRQQAITIGELHPALLLDGEQGAHQVLAIAHPPGGAVDDDPDPACGHGALTFRVGGRPLPRRER